MRITRKEVEHVATLARLKLDEAEIATFTGQMDAILSYVDKLSELNTDGIIPTSHAVPMENAFRPDETYPSLDALVGHCRRQREASMDHWVAPTGIRTRPVGSDGLLLTGGEDKVFQMNDWSFGQLCRLDRPEYR